LKELLRLGRKSRDRSWFKGGFSRWWKSGSRNQDKIKDKFKDKLKEKLLDNPPHSYNNLSTAKRKEDLHRRSSLKDHESYFLNVKLTNNLNTYYENCLLF